ncbi:MAG: DUF2490 domain-containing protein [Cytophagaceae bacterium]|nr:DUF2490 domain-containing protein [Cytophagaceae bacterium]
MNIKSDSFLILYFIILLPNFVFSQNHITQQNLMWFRAMTHTNLSKKLYLVNEIDNRRFIEGNIQHHTIQHNHLHYKVNPKFDVAWGQTFSWQSPQFPDAEKKLVIPEIRPFQEFNFSENSMKNVIFSTRLRIDERFIRKNDGVQLFDGYNFNFRYRTRLQMQFLVGKKKKDNVKVIDELMLNSGKNVNFFDQNRVYVGFEKYLLNNTSLEIGYLRWYQQRQTIDTYFQRNIIRFTLLQKLNLTKK